MTTNRPRFSRSFFLMLVALSWSVPATSHGKRAAAPKVADLTVGQMVIRVSNAVGEMGLVKAFDKKSGVPKWSSQLYVVKINPNLEKDIQAIFIARLWQKDGSVFAEDERGRRYQIEPSSGQSRLIEKARHISKGR